MAAPASPLISIVIATKNAAAVLPRCLQSLREQTFRDFEVLVMDGASMDGTPGLLRDAGDVVSYWRSEPDSGVYGAWNKALARARGEWIAFLGADDRLCDEGALDRLVPALRGAYPAHRVVYGRVRLVDAHGRCLEEMGQPWPAVKERFRRRPCIPQPGLMHHRTLFERHGAFDEAFRLAADYELLLRELKSADACHVPTPVVDMGQGGMSTDPRHFLRLLRETRDALALHGLRPPTLLWSYWIACAWLYDRGRRVLGEGPARLLADLYRVMTLRAPRYFTRASRSGTRARDEKPAQGR